jgi:HSP20 family protein
LEDIMPITRWDPFREVATLQNRMNSLFQDFSRQGDGDTLATAAFVPAADVYEDEHKITIKLEVPGVKESDLDVRVENNVLTIRGERKFEKEEKEENFQRIERRYGSFYRSFVLPTTVDTDNVKAQYDSGVLRIELQRRAEAKPKQIKIGVSSSTGQPQQVEGGKAEAGKETKTAA